MLSLTDLRGKFASSRQTLLVALAVVLAVLALLRAGISWYGDLSERVDSAIEIKSEQFDRLTRLLAGAESYRQTNQLLTELQKQFIDNHLITGETPSLADAAFQNFIKQVSDRTNVPIRVMRALPPTRKDNLAFLNMNISSRAEVGAIRDFLLAVRNSGKYVFFTEVEIQRLHMRERRFFNFNAKLAAMTLP